MSKSRTTNTPRRSIRCYLCGHGFEVSGMTMSVPCPRCNKALKVEDVHVKTYVPVNDLQTCGKISVAKNGRVVAKVIRAGQGVDCDGTLEGAIEADTHMVLTAKATWKGKSLVTRSLVVEDGAKLHGHVKVPWERPLPEPPVSHARPASSAKTAKTAARAVGSSAAGSNPRQATAGKGANPPPAAAELKPIRGGTPAASSSPEPAPPSSAEAPAMP